MVLTADNKKGCKVYTKKFAGYEDFSRQHFLLISTFFRLFKNRYTRERYIRIIRYVNKVCEVLVSHSRVSGNALMSIVFDICMDSITLNLFTVAECRPRSNGGQARICVHSFVFWWRYNSFS